MRSHHRDENDWVVTNKKQRYCLSHIGSYKARNYKIEIAVGAREVWTALVVILGTGAVPNLVSKKIMMTAWILL